MGDAPLLTTIIPVADIAPSPRSALVSCLDRDTEYLPVDSVDAKGCIIVAAGERVSVWATEHTVQRTENIHGLQHTSREVSRPPSLRQSPRMNSRVGSCWRVVVLVRG